MNLKKVVYTSYPHKVLLDRRPSRHVGFGWGAHTCLGAFHARLVLRRLNLSLCEQFEAIEIIDAEPLVEQWPAWHRRNGFEQLQIRLIPRPAEDPKKDNTR